MWPLRQVRNTIGTQVDDLGGVGAVLGAGYARAVTGDPDPTRALRAPLVAAAAVVCVATIVLLLPRGTGHVTAALSRRADR